MKDMNEDDLIKVLSRTEYTQLRNMLFDDRHDIPNMDSFLEQHGWTKNEFLEEGVTRQYNAIMRIKWKAANE